MGQPANIAVLLGGLTTWGWENRISSSLAGLDTIVNSLQPYGTVTTYPWNQWQQVKLFTTTSNAVIGYSGGGSRAAFFADWCGKTIDLLIAIDPSPAWQVPWIYKNVLKAICFKNSAPMMPSPYGMLGGGELVGNTNITTIPIAAQHLVVPRLAIVQETIIAAVRELVETHP